MTDEDRRKAAVYLRGLGVVSRRDAAEILAGLWDDTNHVTAFADHRNAGLERAAVIVSGLGNLFAGTREGMVFDGLAAAIRAEKEKALTHD